MINREMNILGRRWEESTERECRDKKVPTNYLKQIDFTSKFIVVGDGCGRPFVLMTVCVDVFDVLIADFIYSQHSKNVNIFKLSPI